MSAPKIDYDVPAIARRNPMALRAIAMRVLVRLLSAGRPHAGGAK